MAPAYRDGQRLLARRARGRPLQRGDVAVFATPEPWRRNGSRWLVKRVIAVAGDEVPHDIRVAVNGADRGSSSG